MMDIGGIQGQVAVIDARTSDVLAWGALENAEGDIAYAPLLKRFCSSEIFMPFIAADCLAQSNTSMEDSVDTRNGILEVNDSMCVRDHNFRRGGYGKLTYKQALLKRSRISMFPPKIPPRVNFGETKCYFRKCHIHVPNRYLMFSSNDIKNSFVIQSSFLRVTATWVHLYGI